MMPRHAEENVVCIACGAGVRREALFCYNCGGAVAVDAGGVNKANPKDESVESKLADHLAETKVDEMVPESKLGGDQPKFTAAKNERKPLTAAMLRRKRASNRQPVEIVWEEPSQPSMLFAIASAVLTLLTALILAAALYLK
jgi:hypothetical protein